jgi:hypothetical protein
VIDLRETLAYDLGDVVYTVDPDSRRVVSCWPDGRETVGTFSYTEEDIARARALGYQGSDAQVCEQLHAEHDLAHHLVAQALGWPSSVVLRMAAEGRTRFPVGVYQLEERLAFLVQRVGNVGLRQVAAQTVSVPSNTEGRAPDGGAGA